MLMSPMILADVHVMCNILIVTLNNVKAIITYCLQTHHHQAMVHTKLVLFIELLCFHVLLSFSL